MEIINFVSLILFAVCVNAQAETCDVGVDGCSWTCKTTPPKPGYAQCDAFPATPTSCVPGSNVTICGTTCTCAKAETCDVGVNGCSWTCKTTPPKPGYAQCDAFPATPTSCVPGSNVSLCGTTCTCAKAETCEVGVDGCSWTCNTTPPKPGQVQCFAIPGTPTSCVPGSSVSSCGTTCTCAKAKTCKVGVDGCTWTCGRAPASAGHVTTCLAIPGTPENCVPGSNITVCGTTCACAQQKKCTVGKGGCKWTCSSKPVPPGTAQCYAFPATPSQCYPGETASACGTTCTCSIEEECSGSSNVTLLRSLYDTLIKLIKSLSEKC